MRPALPPQAEAQLEACRQLMQQQQQQQVGSRRAAAAAAAVAPYAAQQIGDASWLEVLRMWSRGTDMVQADTPAFALHLWQRVRPLVRTKPYANPILATPPASLQQLCNGGAPRVLSHRGK